jgi:hypothetical protein
MPKTTTLAPIIHPTTGEPVAAGAEITLSDEDYAALRAAGTVAASEKEQKAGQLEAGPEGVYNARTTRADTGEVTPTTEEAPKAKKG